MRRLAFLLCAATLLAGFPLTCHFGPRVLDALTAPPHDPEAPVKLRAIARQAVERYERLYGHLPQEEWPEQPRASYLAAKRYLAELDARH